MVVKVHGGVFDNQSLQGGLRYFDIEETNMTVNTLGDAGAILAQAQVIIKGTGHAAADILTFVGGTFGTASTITVDTVTPDGAIASFTISQPGAYTIIPTNPITVTSSGTGTPLAAIVDAQWFSSIIIPNAGSGSGDYLVPYLDAIVGSAVDQVLNEVSTKGTIVQIAIIDAATVRVVLENSSMGWDTPVAGDAAAELEDAIQALGTVDVPDTTSSGGTFALAAATVTEVFLDALT